MFRRNRKSEVFRLLIVFSMFAVFTVPGLSQGARGAANPFSVGDSNAPYQIEVFYDFQCPSCAVFHKTLASVIEKHGEKLRVTIRHFPLTIHDKAFDSAMAVEAAGEQGKFWEMASLMLKKQSDWATSERHLKTFRSYAKSLNLDLERFNEFRSDVTFRRRVEQDIERARSLDLGSVPTVILNGRLLSFTEFTELEEIILRGN